AREAAAKALAGFIGEVEQIPPQFSAVKIDGQRAHDLPRAGGGGELRPRRGVVYEAEIAGTEGGDFLTSRVRCGKGFYIRALVRDLAAKLGAEGHVWRLRRTAAGPFRDAKSATLGDLR